MALTNPIEFDSVPEALREAVEAQKVVLFLGAGASIPSGLPSWSQATKDLLEQAGRLGIRDAGYLKEQENRPHMEVASSLLPDFPLSEKARFFWERFSSRKLNDVHHVLRRLSFRRIITTNWDCLAEEMNEDLLNASVPGVPWQNDRIASFTQDDAVQMAAASGGLASWVFHWHGIYYRTETIVWSEAEMHLAMDKKVVDAFLTNALADQTVLYVGFSLDDPHFRRINQRMLELMPERTRLHYAVLPNASTPQKNDWMKRNVSIMSYKTEPIGSSGEDHLPGLIGLLSAMSGKDSTYSGSNTRWGRSGEATRGAVSGLLRRLRAGRALPCDHISVYASTAASFASDHKTELVEYLALGGKMRILLVDDASQVSLAALKGASVSITEWRQMLERGSLRRRAANDPLDETFRLISDIDQSAKLRASAATKVDVRFCSSFPTNTICHIGTSLFDCPRPVGQRSFQSPMIEHRFGSSEFEFYLNQFEALWKGFGTPVPKRGARTRNAS